MTQTLPIYPGPTADNLACIPDALTQRDQWVLWHGVETVDEATGEIKLNKVPYDPQTLHKASTTDSSTWGTFSYAVTALPVALEGWALEHPGTCGGVGYVFRDDDPYVGIDLDHSVDETTGMIAPWAQAHVDGLSSYTELSPSGTGLHVIVEGTLPPHGRKKGPVEMYAYARFFTMTGWRLETAPPTIEARQEALAALHLSVFGPPQTPRAGAEHALITLDDTLLLAKTQAARNGAKFATLWAGDTSLHAGDDSSADLALCCMLAFWTQDPEQLDRLFRQSGLMRKKWDSKRADSTYGARTIDEALARQTEHYTPGGAARQRGGRNGQTPETMDRRPQIVLSTEVSTVTDEAEAALMQMPGAPLVYQRARGLCVIASGGTPPKWMHRPEDMPLAVDAGPARLRELMSDAAAWVKKDKRAQKYEPALPPLWTVETLRGRGTWLFPSLEGLIASPTLRPDGSLLDTPGYDPSTGLFLETNGTAFPPMPAHPSKDDACAALGQLTEAFMNFPFAADCHRSAALAAILSLVCRFAILGTVPLFAIRANVRASGKSLAADVISILGTGRPAPRWPQVTDFEEERKRLLTVALAGYPCLHIDNVVKPLGSPALDMALTAPSFSDRILGKNESREAPLSMIWLASGNNMLFRGDTARRVVPIDLDSPLEKPEERPATDFTHYPLLPWIRQERPRLTMAALTLVTAYFEAGCPPQRLTPMGSFEAWSDLIRQALAWTGASDPCDGRKEIEAESDPAYERLATLLDAWEACYPIATGAPQGGAKPLREVAVDIERLKMQDKPRQQPDRPNDPNEYDRLQDALGAYDPRYDGKSLRMQPIGTGLNTIQARTIGTKRLIVKGKNRANQSLWCLENPMLGTRGR